MPLFVVVFIIFHLRLCLVEALKQNLHATQFVAYKFYPVPLIIRKKLVLFFFSLQQKRKIGLYKQHWPFIRFSVMYAYLWGYI